MKAKHAVWIIAVLLGVVAFLLTPYIADNYYADFGGDPTTTETIHFAIIGIFESLGIIVGVIFAYRARALLRQGLLSVLTYFSVFWLLVSWWPHDRLHPMVTHGDYRSLIILEYVFHVTLILSAVAVAVWISRRVPVPVSSESELTDDDSPPEPVRPDGVKDVRDSAEDSYPPVPPPPLSETPVIGPPPVEVYEDPNDDNKVNP